MAATQRFEVSPVGVVADASHWVICRGVSSYPFAVETLLEVYLVAATDHIVRICKKEIKIRFICIHIFKSHPGHYAERCRDVMSMVSTLNMMGKID